ncbi:MAG: zinc ribbon domain-containing protein [Candidatus Riflebacteria bacterium]|nr:zinc ribbon domain-containing protein [Candidatus Riflebacteria bacterium]
MPIYEYDCTACNKPFDLLIPVSRRDEPAACPECGSTRTHRKVSLFSARSTSSDGASHAVAGSGCGSCASGSCGSCSHHH